MANTKSAKKALRVTERKTKRNKGIKAGYREARKAVLELVNANALSDAKKELPAAFKKIDKAVKNKVLHKNKAARIKSEISVLVNGVKSETVKIKSKVTKKTK